MADQVSKNGVWIDRDAGKVVESKPVEGVQLVAPGDTITPELQQLIDANKAALADAAKADADKTEAPAEKATTTKS